jgi:hypothetical protein
MRKASEDHRPRIKGKGEVDPVQVLWASGEVDPFQAY